MTRRLLLRALLLVMAVLLSSQTSNLHAQIRFEEIDIGQYRVHRDDYDVRFVSLAREAYYRVIGLGASATDIDRDGDIDLILPGGPGTPDRILWNRLSEEGALRFDAQELNTSPAPWRRSVVSADLDGDGLHELIFHGDSDTAGSPGALILWSSDNWDAASATALRPEGLAATGSVLADPLGDGLLRLIRVFWDMEKADNFGLVRQTTPSTLRNDVSTFFFEGFDRPVGDTFSELEAINGTLFAAALTELDGEQPAELFVTRDLSHNLIFRRDEAGIFRDIRQLLNISVRGSNMGLAAADIDQDDDLDVFVTQIFNIIPGVVVGHRNRLFMNDLDEEGRLRFDDDAAFRGVVATDWGWSAFFRDFNNDGLLDLVVASGAFEFPSFFLGVDHPLSFSPNYLFENTGGGVFEPVVGTPLDEEHNTRLVLPADLDRDGRIDLVEVHLDRGIRVLRNVTSEGTPGLQLLLEPAVAARGATVRSTEAGTLIRRDIVAGEGYLSQAPDEAHIAFSSDVEEPVELEVTWAQGTTTRLMGLPLSGNLRIYRPICSASGGCQSSPGWECWLEHETGDNTVCELVDAITLAEQFSTTPEEPALPTREEVIARVAPEGGDDAGGDDTGDGDAGGDDAGEDDAGEDDAGDDDAGDDDAGDDDAGDDDAGEDDAGEDDAGEDDAGEDDAGEDDAGDDDAGEDDAGGNDAGGGCQSGARKRGGAPGGATALLAALLALTRRGRPSRRSLARGAER